jgi:hypothetical protein
VGNVLEKRCRENEHTHFVFNNVSPKTASFIIPKNIVKTESPQMLQYGAYALHAGLTSLHAFMCMHTLTRQDTHLHARTHAHRDRFPTVKMIRERTSVLHYTNIVRLVFITMSLSYINSIEIEFLKFLLIISVFKFGKDKTHSTRSPL